MTEERLKIWETLFQRALQLIDSAIAAGGTLNNWSFGGGTVLMRRHHHRFSKDVDIFVPDPQILPYLSPRLSDAAESMTTNYIEQAGFIKLVFDEGEIDFVASAPLTENPTTAEILFGRPVQVENSSEIIAKKVWHRGVEFTARDLFDLAMVIELEPEALISIRPILRDRREVVLKRLSEHSTSLREAFAALDVMNYRRTYDECVNLAKEALNK
jgi:predicted nucleotidyltransferase component of viral defense system